MIPYEVIKAKRDGKSLSDEEIGEFISSYVTGEIPDYQMSAFLMAVYLNGMNSSETLALTKSYISSGIIMNYRNLDYPTSDKHSCGGVGDKVSLMLAPMIASCGVGVPMISGRGLGHTGGTLDKLKTIPGFSTDFSSEDCSNLLEKTGLFIVAQSDEMVPADKKIYALRDVTATVESIPLIVASIMSKKLAEGAGSLVLDVTCGNGAFMQTIENAKEISRTMVDVGNLYGVPTAAFITDMNQPLGEYVGNALEIRETIEYLTGELRAKDLHEVVLVLGSAMLVLSKIAGSMTDARKMLENKLDSGEALEKFREFIESQGGDPNVVDNINHLPRAPVVREILAPSDGWIAGFRTSEIGMLGVEMGAGRKTIDDIINPRVGFRFLAKTGDMVYKGQPAAIVFADNSSQAEWAANKLDEFIEFSDEPVEPLTTILKFIGKEEHEFTWNLDILN